MAHSSTMPKGEHRLIDVLVIGSGPIGITVAIEASKRGLKAKVFEKGSLVDSIRQFPIDMTFFSTSKRLEIGDVPFISHYDKPTRREALEYFRRVYESWQLDVHFYEEVLTIESDTDEGFNVMTNKRTYKSRVVVIATGFYGQPNLIQIPGEGLPNVSHYYQEPFAYIGQKVSVIGAANSACDVALELYHKGSDVTMVIRGDQISPRVKYWIKPNIENRIAEGSIRTFFNSTVTAIRPNAIDILTPEGPIELFTDFVLAMTGYRPDYSQLTKWGIVIQSDIWHTPFFNPTTHESNRPDVYLAGVVCGGLKTNTFFIENAKDHATKILTDVMHKLK